MKVVKKIYMVPCTVYIKTHRCMTVTSDKIVNV